MADVGLRKVVVRIPEYLDDLLEEYAKREGLTKSEVIRKAIFSYIRQSNSKIYVTRRVRVY